MWLQIAVGAYRTAPQASTGFYPAELLYGRVSVMEIEASGSSSAVTVPKVLPLYNFAFSPKLSTLTGVCVFRRLIDLGAHYPYCEEAGPVPPPHFQTIKISRPTSSSRDG